MSGRVSVSLLACVVLMAAAGCGGGTGTTSVAAPPGELVFSGTYADAPPPTPPDRGPSKTYSLSEVEAKTDLAPKPGATAGLVRAPNACKGLLILGSDEIRNHEDAGDGVIENPGGTVGIMIDDEADGYCVAGMMYEMDKLP